jgi:hypothetical protein
MSRATPAATPELDEVWPQWREAVNLTATQLERWLETDESRTVGDTGGSGRESTGHRSGRRIVEILGKRKGDLTADDVAHMRTVVGYVHRHRKQRPDGDVTDTRWRYSLMNWGHDPLKG